MKAIDKLIQELEITINRKEPPINNERKIAYEITLRRAKELKIFYQ